MENEDNTDTKKGPWNRIVFTPFYGVDYDEKKKNQAPTNKVKKPERCQKLLGKNKRRDDEE